MKNARMTINGGRVETIIGDGTDTRRLSTIRVPSLPLANPSVAGQSEALVIVGRMIAFDDSPTYPRLYGEFQVIDRRDGVKYTAPKIELHPSGVLLDTLTEFERGNSEPLFIGFTVWEMPGEALFYYQRLEALL